MIYKILGKTGIKASAIGMGCSGVGKNLHNRNDEEAFKTLLEAFESGIIFFDTAPNYNNGDSERLIGKAFKSKRDKIIISGKVGVTFSTAGKIAKKLKPYLYPVKGFLSPVKKNLPNLYRSQRRNNFSKEFILKTVEGSLRRLQTDYLDLLLLHHPTNQILETGDFCEPFELLKAQGKIRFYGVSCDSVEQALLSFNLPGISAIQIELNMIDREPIKDVLPSANQNNIGIIARIPLAKGLLTDKNSDTKAEKWAYDRKLFEERKIKAAKLKSLLNGNRTIVQTALQFLIRQEEVSVALPGFSDRNHLQEIIGSISAKPLTAEELEKINSLSEI